MLKIRRPLGRLIFNMGIAIPGKTVFLIETAPWWWLYSHRTQLTCTLPVLQNIFVCVSKVPANGRGCYMYITSSVIVPHLFSHVIWNCTQKNDLKTRSIFSISVSIEVGKQRTWIFYLYDFDTCYEINLISKSVIFPFLKTPWITWSGFV